MKHEVKKKFGSMIWLLAAAGVCQAQLHVMVMTDTNGNLVAPTNLFSQNSNLLNQAVGGGGGGVTATFDPAWFAAASGGTNALPLSNHLAALSATLSTNATNFAKAVGLNATNTFLAASGGTGTGNTFTNPAIIGSIVVTNPAQQYGLNLVAGPSNTLQNPSLNLPVILRHLTGAAPGFSPDLETWTMDYTPDPFDRDGGFGLAWSDVNGNWLFGLEDTSAAHFWGNSGTQVGGLFLTDRAITNAAFPNGYYPFDWNVGNQGSLGANYPTMENTPNLYLVGTNTNSYLSVYDGVLNGYTSVGATNVAAITSRTSGTNFANYARISNSLTALSLMAANPSGDAISWASSGGSGAGYFFANSMVDDYGGLSIYSNAVRVSFTGNAGDSFNTGWHVYTGPNGNLTNQFTISPSGNASLAGTYNGNGAGLSNLNASTLLSGTVPPNRFPDLTTTTNMNHFALTTIPQISEQFQETSSGLPAGWAYASGGGSTGTAARNGSGLLMTNSTAVPAYNWVYCTSNYNGSHNFHIHCDFQLLMTNGNANAFLIGTKSGNPYDDFSWGMGAYLIPPYAGGLIMYDGQSVEVYTNNVGNGLSASQVFPMTVALGNWFGFDVQVDDDSVYSVLSNKNNGQLSTFAFRQDVSGGAPSGYIPYFGCSGNFGMNMFGGSFLVTNYSVYLTVPKKTDILIWGDSIAGTGAKAVDFEDSWAYRIRKDFAALGWSTVIYGCGSDTTVQSSNELSQVLAISSPSLVLYAAGGNDVADSISSYTTNLPAIKTALAPANVVWVAPTARSATDESGLTLWMLTNNPSGFIDAFDATKAYASYATYPTFTNIYDGIHPNTEGHVAIEAVVRNWLRQNGYPVP